MSRNQTDGGMSQPFATQMSRNQTDGGTAAIMSLLTPFCIIRAWSITVHPQMHMFLSHPRLLTNFFLFFFNSIPPDSVLPFLNHFTQTLGSLLAARLHSDSPKHLCALLSNHNVVV